MQTANWQEIEDAKTAGLEVLLHNAHGLYTMDFQWPRKRRQSASSTTPRSEPKPKSWRNSSREESLKHWICTTGSAK